MSISSREIIEEDPAIKKFYKNRHFSRIAENFNKNIKQEPLLSAWIFGMFLTGLGELLGRKFSILWWAFLFIVFIADFFKFLYKTGDNNEKKV